LAYETAIHTALQTSNATNTTDHHHDHRGTTTTNNKAPQLLALHPRVEQEMLTHRCSKFMEKNLSRVFERMETFPPFFEQNTNGSKFRMDLVFIAVSKAQLAQKAKRGGVLGDIMNWNRVALDNARERGLFGGSNNDNISTASIPMFESGTEVAKTIQFPRLQPSNTLHFVTGNRQKIYPQISPPQNASIPESPYVSALDMGVLEMVASVINFFTAVKAEIFVGVTGSSYSTDVFSVRYYQQKEEGGGENYIVGPNGIERLYGPAAPHSCM